MKIVLSDWAWVDAEPNIIKTLKEKYTVTNPKWIDNHNHGRHNGGVPKFIQCYHQRAGLTGFPRGAMAHLKKYQPQIVDHRHSTPIKIEFNAKLRPFQARTESEILRKDFGTLVAPTGSGKTVMGLSAICQRKEKALIIVHTKELLKQWIERATTFMDIPKKEIGIFVSGRKKRFGDRLTIAMVQTLAKNPEMIPAGEIGHLLIDECHRIPSKTFVDAVSQFDSKFVLGLSATPFRRDKLDNLIWWYAGPISAEVPRDELSESGDILVPDVVVRETTFTSSLDPSNEYSNLISDLTTDKARNLLISHDVCHERNTRPEATVIILSDRKEHCRALQANLKQFGKDSVCLTGDANNGERKRITEQLDSGEIKILIATGQLIGEGYDCKELSTLFLATPIKFSGRLIQYLGRILRPMPGKQATIYDYVDMTIGPLLKSFEGRLAEYRKIGAKIL